MHIPEWGLPGTLPESLCLFEKLEELDFDENAFEGTLPACVGCLPNLREIDIEDNKFTGTIPKEWGNLHGVIEFEIDGNQLLAGCIPEGLPKDAEYCGECWSTCPSYDPYCGAYDCKSCVSWTKDPEIGTSYENTRISGERCNAEPNPPVCPWEIFKEEFEEEQKQKKAALEKESTLEIRSREPTPTLEDILKQSTQSPVKEEAPEAAIPEVSMPVEEVEAVPEVAPQPEESEEALETADTIPESEAPDMTEEAESAPVKETEEEQSESVTAPQEEPVKQQCSETPLRLTVTGEKCVFPMTIMEQVHCDCAVYGDSSWCQIESGDWKECAKGDAYTSG